MALPGMRRADPRGAGVKVDTVRVKKYLAEIRRKSSELQSLLDANDLIPDSIPLKAAKYILIELSEAISNTLQHILAKDQGVAVSGYIDTIHKSYEYGLISQGMYQRLKPFFDFRNSLIHRYWTVDDSQLITNLHKVRGDFDHFIEEVEEYMS